MLEFEVISVKWQCDETRAALKKHSEQVKVAEEFNRTNTDPRMVWYVEGLWLDWRPRKGDIELGYRSDGVVVWRPLPEAP